jgi:hypothetical protein
LKISVLTNQLVGFVIFTCAKILNTILDLTTGFVRVLENLESHGISIFQNPGQENPGKSVMESHGKLKFYITLTKYFTYSIYQS